MNYFKNQEYEFIQRTKKIIEQYEKFAIDKNEKYEVTLLLNCLVGLLILPQQHWFKKLPKVIVCEENWGIGENHISIIKEGEKKTVQNVARHLRNSIAHYRFIIPKNNGLIIRVEFEDFYRNNLTFKSNIPIDSIRKFTTKLTEIFIVEMDKENNPQAI